MGASFIDGGKLSVASLSHWQVFCNICLTFDKSSNLHTKISNAMICDILVS